MGDSFTEAGQVPFPESFAGLLEAAAPRCAVRDYGVRSYSPAIYLVQWTRVIEPWKPTHVFVLVFGGDVREDVEYLKTATLDAQGLPTAIHGPDDGWLVAQLRRSYVARFARMISQRIDWAATHRGQEQWTVGGVVEEHPDWAGPTPRLVEELNRRVQASGGLLTVMVVPSRYRFMGDGKIPLTSDLHDTVADVGRRAPDRVSRSEYAVRARIEGRQAAVFPAGHSFHGRRPQGRRRRNRREIPGTIRPASDAGSRRYSFISNTTSSTSPYQNQPLPDVRLPDIEAGDAAHQRHRHDEGRHEEVGQRPQRQRAVAAVDQVEDKQDVEGNHQDDQVVVVREEEARADRRDDRELEDAAARFDDRRQASAARGGSASAGTRSRRRCRSPDRSSGGCTHEL